MMTDVMGVAHRSQVVKTRRGYTLLGLGFLVPGSAQAIHGSKKLGRFSLKLLIVLALLVIAIVILTLVFRDFMIGVFANGVVMKILAICVFALVGLWALLAINTWWIARPREMGQKKGIVFSVIALILTGALTFGGIWAGSAVWVAGGALSNIFGGGGHHQVDKGRYNVLLLGSDAGPGRWGIRPDSITIASVNANTGRTVLISLPRNLEYVPFPESSPLHALYPDGYGCDTSECLLNAVYLLGQENANLYPGVDDPGIQAMIEATSGATGLTINYYAMINMQGFRDLIDAMGGLRISILERVPINKEETRWLEVGEDQLLDGYEVLWFARSRSTSSDYARMARQKCVMAAMLKQMDPSTVASKFISIASASGSMARTSVPSWKVPELVNLAMRAKSLPIMSVSFTPPLISTGDPDFGFMHQLVKETIAQSEALDVQATATASPSSTGSGDPTDSPSKKPNVTDDLGQVCKVS